MFDNIPRPDFSQIKAQLKGFFSNRIMVVGAFLLFLLFILVYRLFILQIVQGDKHQANLNYKVERTIETSGARGNIYDCNGKLLAYNQLAYSVTLQFNDNMASEAAEAKLSLNDYRNQVVARLIKVLEDNKDEVVYDLPLTLSSSGKIEFTIKGSALTRFKKDIYGITNLDNLDDEDRAKAEKWLNSSPTEVYEYLRSGKNGPTGVGEMFGISDKYSKKETLKIMSVRYDIYMNRYSQTTPITVASNISDRSIAAIQENKSKYPGVTIRSDSLRKYKDAKYFAAIIGYTGSVSENDLEALNSGKEKGKKYKANDVVGKTGIEKTMENTLQGKKGQQKVVVNNLGKVISTVNTTKAEPGDDIYLTIDSNLQKYAYDILERRLAGIILAHLTSSDSTEDGMIPMHNVLFALIDNNVVDISKLNTKTSTANEHAVYGQFKNQQRKVLNHLGTEMQSGTTKIKDLNDEDQEYEKYIYNYLSSEGFLDSSKVDQDDATYIKWKNEDISLRDFMRHAIKKEWIDITSLKIKSDYYDADEIYSELISYIRYALIKDEDFDKLIYKYMIRSNELSGRNVCMLLYDQGVLNKKKDKEYTSLKNGKTSAYDFMVSKIRKIEITPAQLALDPCSGSVIITDPKSGAVKAMVSYPSYDNNRLANKIDNVYYAALNKDKSSPMLNRATQTKTAPGSTFKPISSTALLQENVINQDTYINCTGLFDKISPAAKCWIYPRGHGNLNVSGAIANSCNYFFYTGAYRMGTINGNYNSEYALKKLKKYAKMYGLDRKSGVELTEYSPQISDEDAVRSAIGQGTHSYAPVQISRYLTSLVNQQNLMKLTLLEKSTDTDGSTKEEYAGKKIEKLDVTEHTFKLIKIGMRDVVSGPNSSIKSLYKGLKLKVAGKTGTAQENKKRPNHALFISYAPYDDPKIAMTVVVPNGYTSANAAEIARDIYKYYFNKASNKELNSTGALLPTGSDASND